MKNLIMKNGELSKTCIMMWISYALIITNYAGSIFAGWQFDVQAAAWIWALSSGTMIASNSKLTSK